MSLPTFETTVKNIDTQIEAMIVFNDFVNTFRKEDLFDAAEWYVKDKVPSSIYTFRNRDGGLMQLVIVLIMTGSTNCSIDMLFWLGERLMEHYGFTAESIPPRMIVREAVALRVRLNMVLADLGREVEESKHLNLAIVNVASGLVSPDFAYLLSDGVVDQIIRGL